jgi:hypothetical protein
MAVVGSRLRGENFLEGFGPAVAYNGWHEQTIMKIIKQITAAVLAATFLVAPFSTLAADAKSDAKAKPYPLKTCVVSGEKLGEMGKPYTFTHEGREVQLCCKDCLKDFKKDPAKFVKKIEAAEAKDKKS